MNTLTRQQQRVSPTFLPEEIAYITERLMQDATPQQIAKELGLAHSSFRSKLADSGHRVVIRRHLMRIVPVEAERQEEALLSSV